MGVVSHSESTRATPDEVWVWYEDVSRWPRWDGGVRSVELDGPFASGTRGRVRLPNGRVARLRLSDVEPGRRYTDAVHVRGLTITTHHTLLADGAFTRITHDVVLGGFLGRFFPRLTAIPVRRSLPASVAQLAFLAARGSASAPSDLPLA